MKADRRLAAQLAATLLALPSPQQSISSSFLLRPTPAAAAPPTPLRAVAVVAGGFLIPPEEQYASYAAALERVGCAVRLYADGGTMSRPGDLQAGAQAILAQADELARASGLPPTAPLVLLGHSRGAKTCALAAALSSGSSGGGQQRQPRRVASLVLIDPVDATGPDPSSALGELQQLSRAVPTCILGSGAGAGDCSQNDYRKFAAALASSRSPRLVGVLKRAGHTQFVDNRRVLTVDVCTTGRDRDPAIRDVALAATAQWVEASLNENVEELTEARSRAVATLRETPFEAAVEWESADL